MTALRVGEQCPVVVDNDWSGDPDGLVALAHHLLSPTNRVVAVTSSFLNPMFQAPPGALARRGAGPRAGRTGRRPGRATRVLGQRDLVRRRRCDLGRVGRDRRRGTAEDDLPLYLVCGGPLTNVAAALEQAPDIAERLILVWIGGSLDPSASEYNRDTDPAAADFVFGRPGLVIQQFPLETYRRCAYSVAELEDLGGAVGSASGCGPCLPAATGLGHARRRLAARRQPAGAGHGAEQRVQPLDGVGHADGGASTPTSTSG